MGRAAGGYSLLEALLGLVILLVALVGLLPLFTLSIRQNLEGRQSSEATGHGRSELENLKQIDFNNWLVTITAGNERSQDLYWDRGDLGITGDESWTGTDPGQAAPWQLSSVVRQFGIQGVRDDDLDGIMEVIEGLEDGDLDGEPDSPLAAGTPANFVHIKTFDLVLQNRASAVTMGGPTRLRLSTFKAF